MATAAVDTRIHAHELIDRMAPGQLSAVVGLMEIILDPFARAMANAPYDDEPVSEEESLDLAGQRGKAVPHAEVLAEYGLTSEDFVRMGQTPLEPSGATN